MIGWTNRKFIMKKSRPAIGSVRSSLSSFCRLEQLEVRQFLSTTFPNILPLGDSITESATGHASYRYWLWNALADAGHTVDFVGSHQPAGVAGGPALYPGFDPHHDGYSGWTADVLAAGLAGPNWQSWAAQAQNTPDIALVHIGTNDLELGQGDTSTRDDVGKIIDALRLANPNVTVLLAQIIPDSKVLVKGFNALLPALAAAKNTAQSRVVLVDQYSGFGASIDTYDGVHPNEQGEKKMSAKWLAALTPFLPAPTAPPAGVYLDTPAVTLTSASNAVGPVEYESSNGLSDQFDGQLMSIRGQTFMRGFGVHGPSELVFNLNGKAYSRFRATVGTDDEVIPNGSVVFQVYVNNETTPRFTSAVVTGSSAPLQIDVDITGATSLRLVTTDGGDGPDFDHADWALARVVPVSTTPPPTDPPPGEEEPDLDLPGAPKCLIACYKNNKVELRWKDTANNEAGFLVFRKERGAGKPSWKQVADLKANATSFSDTSLTASAKYSYRVVAYNDEGRSQASNTANANIPPQPKKLKRHKHDYQGQNDNNQGQNTAKKVAQVVQRVVQALKAVFGRR